MEEFKWTENLALHIKGMDDEHIELIRLMNVFAEAALAQKPRSEQRKLYDSLVAYTRRHFAEEEHYMEQIGFSGLGAHRKIHESMLEKLDNYQRIIHSEAKFPTEEVFGFLKFWLVAHIKGIDMKYAEHSRTRKSA